jgi:hypothetical protein
MSMPLENIHTLLQDFLAAYRPLIWLSMVNAFGYAIKSPTQLRSTFADPAKVFYITLSAVPNLSLSTKARAAFHIKDARAFTMDSFRESISNKEHPLHHIENGPLVGRFDNHVAQMREAGRIGHRMGMGVLFLDFSNGVRRSQYFKDMYFADDPARDYSMQWRPDDWLEYLKTEVAKGKRWHRDDISFF